MYLLVLTGQLAYPHAQELVSRLKLSVQVKALPISLASFMTPQMVELCLREEKLSSFDAVLVSGLIPWDTKPIEAIFKLPIRKGPQNLEDLPALLETQKITDLSTKAAADVLLSKYYDEEYAANLKRSDCNARKRGLPRNFILPRSKLLIGMDVPPQILAQVVNATRISEEEVIANAKFFVERGASIIDIGGDIEKENPQKLGQLISRIRAELGVPVAIDSMRPSEIRAGVAAGAEIVLSIDLGNLSVLNDLPKDIVLTIIPTNVAMGKFFADPIERVKTLHDLYEKCQKMGFQNFLADPLLGAPIQPGFVKSLVAYFMLHDLTPSGLPALDIPILFGAENVFEMVDMDSTGVNGLLASIAVELQAGVILATEFSPKTQNTIDEFHRGIQLSYLAKIKRTPPKDLGFSLLQLKTKHKNPIPPEILASSKVIQSDQENFIPDPAGYFKIYSHFRMRQVIVAHYSNTNRLEGVYASDSGEQLSKFLIREGLVTRLDHAAYLGREIAKAESCAKSGGNYFQID